MTALETRMRRPSIERALRQLLTNPATRGNAREKLEMDDSQVSRFLSGQAGLPIDKIDRALDLVDMVLVRPAYLAAMVELADTGVSCSCALAGGGNCGGKW